MEKMEGGEVLEKAIEAITLISAQRNSMTWNHKSSLFNGITSGEIEMGGGEVTLTKLSDSLDQYQDHSSMLGKSLRCHSQVVL